MNLDFDLFPSQFDFYKLGQVTQNTAKPSTETLDLTEDLQGLYFTLYGAEKSFLLFFFDKSLNFSTYCEMSNIIASQIADGLARKQNSIVLVSSPLKCDPAKAKQLMERHPPEVRCVYTHTLNKKTDLLYSCLLSHFPIEEIYV